MSSYRFPYLKVVEYIVKQGDKTTVLFLSKVKLMGWEKSERMPEILNCSDVEVVLGNSEVVLRSREGLESKSKAWIQSSRRQKCAPRVSVVFW